MTKQEILQLERLETDDQNEEAIKYIDEYLDANDMDNPELEKLSDLVYEFETRTDVMSRKSRI